MVMQMIAGLLTFGAVLGLGFLGLIALSRSSWYMSHTIVYMATFGTVCLGFVSSLKVVALVS